MADLAGARRAHRRFRSSTQFITLINLESVSSSNHVTSIETAGFSGSCGFRGIHRHNTYYTGLCSRQTLRNNNPDEPVITFPSLDHLLQEFLKRLAGYYDIRTVPAS